VLNMSDEKLLRLHEKEPRSAGGTRFRTEPSGEVLRSEQLTVAKTYSENEVFNSR
jgi:hypothetical protein